MLNWDDLRILAAVCEYRTFSAACKKLDVDETTVARRVSRLERMLGVKLLDAIDGERRPTAACTEILLHTGAIACHVDGISRLTASMSKQGPAGAIRIATTNALAEEILAPRLSDFLTKHPGLTISLLTSTRSVNFSRWEADLAIRLRKPERGEYMISKLATIPLYFFEPVGPQGRRSPDLVCAYPHESDDTPETRFLIRRELQAKARCITGSGRVIRTLIASQRAMGILPLYLCSDLLADPALKATLLPQRREVWLLIQKHLGRDSVARTTIDWLRSCFAYP